MKNIVLAMAFGSLAVSTAFAQSSFQTVDTDANGTVSYTEAVNAGLPWSEEQFKQADTDSDGELNSDEFAAAIQ